MKLTWTHLPAHDLYKEALTAADSDTGAQKVFAVNYKPWRVIIPSELNSRSFTDEKNLKLVVEQFYSDKK